MNQVLYDYGETVDFVRVLRREIRKSRRGRWCDVCGNPIAKGECYTSIAFLDGSEFGSQSQCLIACREPGE